MSSLFFIVRKVKVQENLVAPCSDHTLDLHYDIRLDFCTWFEAVLNIRQDVWQLGLGEKQRQVTSYLIARTCDPILRNSLPSLCVLSHTNCPLRQHLQIHCHWQQLHWSALLLGSGRNCYRLCSSCSERKLRIFELRRR